MYDEYKQHQRGSIHPGQQIQQLKIPIHPQSRQIAKTRPRKCQSPGLSVVHNGTASPRKVSGTLKLNSGPMVFTVKETHL